MKIALCLSGFVGSPGVKNRSTSKSSKSVLDIGYRKYKKHIIQKNNVDIFIHSWDVAWQKQINRRYKPIKSIYQKSIEFKQPNYIKSEYSLFNNICNMWYSRKMAVALKRKWEQENNFIYDYVMWARFDIAWERDIDFHKFDMDCFYVGKWCEFYMKNKRQFKGGRGRLYDIVKKDKNIIKQMKHTHKGYPNTLGRGLLDFWFFSNSSAMDRFFTMSDKMLDYFNPKKEKQLFSKYPLVFPSSHIVILHHVREIGLLEKLKFAFHLYDDFPLVRRKYLHSRR